MIDSDFISVLIVNYQGEHYLPGCLQALEEQSLPRHRFEVLVWDNASTDGSAALVQQRFGWVRWLASPFNLGYAEANNRLAHYARGARIVLLNHDTVPDPFFLEELVRVWDRDPTGRVVSKLMLLHQPNQIHSTGLVLLRDARGADRGFLEIDVGQYERCEVVFGGCGAALGLGKPKPEQVLFPSHYFTYYEDVALAWAFQNAGGRTWYVPRSLVLHAHGGAGGHHSERFHFYVERNRALTALRYGSAGQALFTFAVITGKCVRSIFASALGKQPPARLFTHIQALLSYLRYLPRTLWARGSRG